MQLCSFANAQTPGCSFSRIKGPLLVNRAGAPSPSTYKLDLLAVGHWSVVPANAGTVSTTNSVNSVTVTWNPGVAGNAYVVCDGTPDTLFTQAECNPLPPEVPAGTRRITDFDCNDPATTGQLFNDPHVNVVSGPLVKEVTVTGATFFIEGQFNCFPNMYIKFDNCTLYMAKGAIIYSRNGYSASFGDGSFISQDSHFYGTSCGMWQGIIAPSDGKIFFDKSTISDAEFGVEMDGCILGINSTNTNFYNNCVSIYAPNRNSATGNIIKDFSLSPSNSIIQNSRFESLTSMIYPTFNGQHCMPVSGRPYAGFLLYNLRPQNSTSRSIPFSIGSSAGCKFTNLANGIIGINSQLDVHNCDFTEISSFAIHSINTCSFCPDVLQLNVGNTSTYSNNTFDKCYYGVFAEGEIDATILSNSFDHSDPADRNRAADIYVLNARLGRKIDIEHNTISNYRFGTVLNTVSNSNVTIYDNHYFGAPLFNTIPPSSYSSTGLIILAGRGDPLMHAWIAFNDFNDSRIAMYLNGVEGTAPDLGDFSIQSNQINNDISFTDLSNLYNNGFNSYGIWCDNTRSININGNYFNRSINPAGAPQRFDQMLRALNIKQSQWMPITGNSIYNYGTPMRFVSACNNANLMCNIMDNCYSGIYLDVAGMTQQGAANNPWDNIWSNYPNGNRVMGTTTGNQIRWYHQGSTCFSSPCGNDYSPGPYDFGTVAPFANESGPQCGGGGGGESAKLIAIAQNSIQYSQYPAESRYYDKEFAYEVLKKDSNLRDSLQVLSDFFYTEQQNNMGKFDEAKQDAENGDLALSLSKLNIIVDQNVIEYNKKYIRTLELQKEISGDNTYTAQEIQELTNIAYQTAWEGGDAVFEARGKLLLEVDDQENHLRIGRKINSVTENTIDVFPNPSAGEITIRSGYNENSELRIYDAFGRIVYSKQKYSGTAYITDLAKGVYSIQLVENGQILFAQKLIVL